MQCAVMNPLSRSCSASSKAWLPADFQCSAFPMPHVPCSSSGAGNGSSSGSGGGGSGSGGGGGAARNFEPIATFATVVSREVKDLAPSSGNRPSIGIRCVVGPDQQNTSHSRSPDDVTL